MLLYAIWQKLVFQLRQGIPGADIVSKHNIYYYECGIEKYKRGYKLF